MICQLNYKKYNIKPDIKSITRWVMDLGFTFSIDTRVSFVIVRHFKINNFRMQTRVTGGEGGFRVKIEQ